MKEVLKKLILYILMLEAKIVLKRFKPKIIAITGSVGKTTAKDAIYSALKDSLHIRKNQKSFNSEIGIPLTVLGLDTGWNSIFLWLKNILKGLLVPFSRKYPKWLVLEVGVDRPGDMDVAGKILRPDMIIYTAMGKTPVHVEYFGSPEAVWEEKKKLAKYLQPNGVLFLNTDDSKVFSLKESVENVTISTYGMSANADTRLLENIVKYNEAGKPEGIVTSIQTKENSAEIFSKGVLGIQHSYPLTIAYTVGRALDIPSDELVERLKQHTPPHGRMNILDGINSTILIDDTYNASPIATEQALKAVASLRSSGKKIAVLGDMLELGRFSIEEHQKIGELVFNLGYDLFIAVGLRFESGVKRALEMGMPDDKVISLKKSDEVFDFISGKFGAGDIILLKGSQGIRMERAVKSLLKDPATASEQLIRQDSAWKDR